MNAHCIKGPSPYVVPGRKTALAEAELKYHDKESLRSG